MSDQYTGDYIVHLMRTIDEILRRVESSQDVSEPNVKPGGIVVDVGGGVKVGVGPEIIESFRRIEARRQQTNANGDASEQAQWQTQDPQIRTIMRAVAKEAGFPDLFDLAEAS